MRFFSGPAEAVVKEVPPLRERPEEIPLLAVALLEQLCRKYGRETLDVRPDDLEAMGGYAFPGNVRELRNLLERSLMKTSEDQTWLALDHAWLEARTADAPAARKLTALEAQEYDMIGKVLQEEHGGIRRAATRLGLSHQALLRRLQKWPELRPTDQTQAVS